MAGKEDAHGRAWILENARRILDTYSGQPITIRQLYYRLVTIGMPNNIQHYKRVDAAMTEARWDGVVDMEAFVDRERAVAGRTESNEIELEDKVRQAKQQVKAWMTSYRLERWSNQKAFVEVWIEKKALQGVFEGPCNRFAVALAPCKGYPSLTFLHEAMIRFSQAQEHDKEVVILYFGDRDPSGDDIPRSLEENLGRMGVQVTIERIALTEEQVTEMNLPSAPTKGTDSRSAAWDGEGAVELDAIEPRTLTSMCEAAIKAHWDEAAFRTLRRREESERNTFQEALKAFVASIGTDDEDEDTDDTDDDAGDGED